MAIDLKPTLDKIMKLPLPKKVGIAAAINVIIIGLIVYLLILPTRAEVKDLRVQMDDLNAKLNESRLIAADIPKFLNEKEELEKKLELALAQLPNEKEIPDLIDAISSSGEKAGLKILLFRPGKETKKGFYAEIPVSMSIAGKFESLFDFSTKVAKLPRIVNLGGIDVGSEGHKNRVPQIKATFTATTFRFIPADVPPAEKK